MVVRMLAPGIYRIYWISGGSSIAAVGVTENGNRWIAPINWLRPSSEPLAWGDVQSVTPLLGVDQEKD